MLRKSDRRGATAVEFAIASPVLIAFVFGCIEFSRVAMLRHTANHAAYIATRKAIVPGANVADVVNEAEQHLEMIGVRGGVVTVSPSIIVDATEQVDVEVTFPVSDNSLIVPEFVSGQIVGTSAMLTERPKAVMSLNLPEPPPPPPPSTAPTGTNDDNDDDDHSWPTTPPPAPPAPVL